MKSMVRILIFPVALALCHVPPANAQWVPTNEPYGGIVRCIASSGTNLFAGTDVGGVFRSTNNGATCSAVNEGLTKEFVTGLVASGAGIFVGTSGGSVLRRPLSQMITSVEAPSTALLAGFTRDKNYPNPFNPLTIIRYAVPLRSQVTLTVFNALGQPVSTLVSGSEEAGRHEVKFDGSNLASGVYFYRIQAGSFIQAKKLVLLR